MLHQIPLSLIGLRILLAPVLLIMYGFDAASVWYGVVLTVGFSPMSLTESLRENGE